MVAVCLLQKKHQTAKRLKEAPDLHAYTALSNLFGLFLA